MLIGQNKLKAYIRGLVVANLLPQFIILVGNKGQGRSTMVNYIAEIKDCPVLQPETLKVDDIREIIGGANKLSSDIIYYLKDADDMTNQAENALLKLAEEPPKHCFIIMAVESTDNILPTIKSRGAVYTMEQYSLTELQEFTKDKLILKVAANPGEIKTLEEIGAEDLYNFAKKVLDNIGTVSTINSLNIYKYIKLKDEEEGYPLDLFLAMMIRVALEQIRDPECGKDKAVLLTDTLTQLFSYRGKFKVKGANKLALFDIMVLDLRKIWR